MAWARDAKRLAEDGYLVVDLPGRADHRPADDAGGDAAAPDRERLRGDPAAGLRARQGRRRVSVREQRRRMGGRRTGDPAADGEPPVARRVSDGPRDVVRHDGERLPRADRSAGPAGRLPARASSSPARDDCRLREGVGTRRVAGAARTIPRGAAAHGRRAARGIWRRGSSRRSKPCRRATASSRVAALAGLVGDQALPFLEYRESAEPAGSRRDPARTRAASCCPIASIAPMPRATRSSAPSSTTRRRSGGRPR